MYSRPSFAFSVSVSSFRGEWPLLCMSATCGASTLELRFAGPSFSRFVRVSSSGPLFTGVASSTAFSPSSRSVALALGSFAVKRDSVSD